MGNVTTAAHDHNPAHAARGAQLVMDAVVRVLVRDGLDGLSVRRVAAEAGISIGAVQHHFATKDALLVAAAEHVTTQFKSRADELTRRALAEEGPTAAFLVFCQLLANAVQGSDEETEDTAASIIWLWYAAKATQRGVVADAFTTGWSQTEKGAVANFRRRAVTTQSSSSDARCGSAFSGSLE
ncbi:TetR/AcrR family transcriptional regulator, partial [Corynebacterium doosanense]